MLLVKLKNAEQKWEIFADKRKLKGRKERISEDLTWRERKIRWRMGEIVKKEASKERRILVKGIRMRIEGQWWR